MGRLCKKKVVAIGMIGIMSATMLTGCKISSDIPILGKIFGLHSNEIFEVDSLICSDDEYKLVFMNYVNKYKKDFGGKIDWDAKVDQETTFTDFIKEKVKEDITVKYTLSAMAETERVKLDKDDMELINDAVDEYYQSLDDVEKEYINSDIDVVARVYSNYYLADKVYKTVTESVGENVSEEQARVVKIQYIKMSVGDKSASEIQSKLKRVAKAVKSNKISFSQEAKQYSEDDSIERIIKKNEAKTKMETESFNLKKDKMSEIIQDGNDYYLIYCVENYMKEETSANKEEIIENKKQATFKKEYDAFLKEVDYDFNTSEWDDIMPEDVEGTKSSNFLEIYNNM